VLSFTLGEGANNEEVKFTEMKEAMEGVRYIDFTPGGTSGSVRFESNAARTTCLEGLQAGTLTVLVGGAEAAWAIIEGDEEKEYWKAAFAAMKVS